MNCKVFSVISALLIGGVGFASMAQTALTVKDQINVKGGTQAYADGSKTVAYTTANNSVWYLGSYDLSQIKSIEVTAGMVSGKVNDVMTAPQLKFAYRDCVDGISVDAAYLDTNSGDIRSAKKLLAQIEAVTEPTDHATEGHKYPGAKFTITAADVTVDAESYEGTVTLNSDASKHLQKTSGVVELFVYATAQSRRVTIDNVTIHFAGEVSGEGEQTATILAVKDTQWRMGNTNNNAKAASVEVRSDWSETDGVRTYKNDFVAAYEFLVPAAVLNATVKSATLRLVTERAKGANEMDVFAYPYEWADNQVYADQAENIAQAREAAPVATFTAKCFNTTKCVTDEYDFTDISVWTNHIDLTEYVRSSTDGRVSLLIASQRSSGNQKMFYTSEATDVLAGKITTVPASDLVPQLTIVYEVAGKELVSVSTEKYRSYASPKAVSVPNGITAYTVSACAPYNASGVSTYAESVDYCAQLDPIQSGVIPANTGVILLAKVPAEYSFAYASDEAAVENNLLKVSDGSEVSSGYTFGVTDGVPMFSPISSPTVIPAGEVYLDFAADDVRNMYVIEGSNDKPTAVASVKAETPVVKGIYNLQGMKLNSINEPGIYIIDGKKIAVSNPSLYNK